MPLIYRPQPWRQQPPGGADLRLPFRLFWSVNHRAGNNIGVSQQPIQSPMVEGMAGDWTGTQWIKGDRPGLAPDRGFTCLAYAVPGSGGLEYLVASNYDGNTEEPFSFRFNGANVEAATFTGSIAYLAAVGATGSVPRLFFGYFGDRGAPFALEVGWVANDGLITRNVSTAPGGVTRTTFDTYIGAGANNTTPWRSAARRILYAGLVDGRIDDGTLSELGRNPWGIFEPQRIWVPAGVAGGAPTLTALSPINVTATSARPRVSLTF